MLTLQNINDKNMAAHTDKENVSIVKLLACKCPSCRKGDMFKDKNPWNLKNTIKMNTNCPVWDQPPDLEPGFYFRSSYVSYALTVAFSALTFIAWYKLIGFCDNEKSLLYRLILMQFV